MISDDWVVRYENRFFQLEPESRHYAPARGKVLVGEGWEGSLRIEYQGRPVRWREIAPPVAPSAEPRTELGCSGAGQGAGSSQLPKRKWVPPADHPWRSGYAWRAAGRALGFQPTLHPSPLFSPIN